MRHWPIAEVMVVLVLGAALLIPLVHVTGQTSAPNSGTTTGTTATTNAATTVTPCYISIRSPHVLENAALVLNEELFFLSEEAGTRFDIDIDLNLEARHLELGVLATWTAGTPESVVEIIIEPDGLEAAKSTLWGLESIDDIATFTWP